MSDSPNDESRLRATEAQMRRALGLQESAPSSVPAPAATPAAVTPGVHRPARRFARDGEVAVSVIHRDAGSNQLETTRQALRAQVQAREQAERQLADAQATIRDLQTKLAHERMAKEELERRAAAEKQAHEQALERVREELSAVQAAAHETEQRLQALIAKYDRTPRIQERTAEAAADSPVAEMPALPRRRGRPPKVRQPEPEASEPESDIVEWWKPGWRDRYR